jgi:Flp pilus assembly protein TadD
MDGAITNYQSALKINPDYLEAHNNLGLAFLEKGQTGEAVLHFQKALELQSGLTEAHYNLGRAFFQEGRMAAAIAHYQKALELQPTMAECHLDLGNAFLQEGRTDQAVLHYEKALELQGQNNEALGNLAWVLATSPQAALRNGTMAIALARQANQLTGGNNPVVLHTLAAAYAEAGRFSEALENAHRALRLAEHQSDSALTLAIRREIARYRAGSPVRDTPQAAVPSPPARP